MALNLLRGGFTGSHITVLRNAKKPQPKQHKYRENVRCHGLLRCTNKDCLKATPGYEDAQRRRLWNRDTAAVLNFHKILMAHRMGKETRAPAASQEQRQSQRYRRLKAQENAKEGSCSTSDSVASTARPRKRARVSSVPAPSIAVSVNINDDARDDAQLLLQRLLLNN
ncbi:hypothetical protein H4R99_004999 [Coemansia sp. RSA 1722]|nr:hypothetical protein H4R99_004999 [Coemansia sp. RSA 1722]